MPNSISERDTRENARMDADDKKLLSMYPGCSVMEAAGFVVSNAIKTDPKIWEMFDSFIPYGDGNVLLFPDRLGLEYHNFAVTVNIAKKQLIICKSRRWGDSNSFETLQIPWVTKCEKL
jgi:hypothetical protein